MLQLNQRDSAAANYRKVIPAGEYWMHEVRKGETLRIVDL